MGDNQRYSDSCGVGGVSILTEGGAAPRRPFYCLWYGIVFDSPAAAAGDEPGWGEGGSEQTGDDELPGHPGAAAPPPD